MLKFRNKIKVFSNKSDISFCLKSVESLNCFLRVSECIKQRLPFVLSWDKAFKRSIHNTSTRITRSYSPNHPTPPTPTAPPLHANQIYSILAQSFDLRLCASQVHYISKPQYTFLYTRKSSVSVHRSRIFQTLLKNQLETYLHTKD